MISPNTEQRGFLVVVFNKPKIEIAEISEDKKYGKFVVEPLERAMAQRLAIPLEELCFPLYRSCCKSGKD